MLCQRVLNRWLLDEARTELPSVPQETGAYKAYRFPVSPAAHKQARVIAAGLDISISTLMIRIMHTFVPFEVEILAAAMASAPLVDTEPDDDDLEPDLEPDLDADEPAELAEPEPEPEATP